jgi:hypothetical protein
VSSITHTTADADDEALSGADFKFLLEALNRSDNYDLAGYKAAGEGSALQRHHNERLKVSRKLADKLLRMAASTCTA